jgi:hypothetical protein
MCHIQKYQLGYEKNVGIVMEPVHSPTTGCRLGINEDWPPNLELVHAS